MSNPLLYLASASPRRKVLLEQLALSFSVLHVDVEEKQQVNEKAADYVRRLSFDKALAGVAVSPLSLPVLGADTIVVVDDLVLEKPKDLNDAKRILGRLSARSHQVMTAVTIADQSHHLTCCVETRVWFKPLTDAEIEKYWQTGEPQDKAGSYAIQGSGGRFVTRIDGSYHAVVGLPLFETERLIHQFQRLRGENT